jgi:hypothetical protein
MAFIDALVFITILLFSFVFWIWMLIDCVTKEKDEGNSRLIWVLVIVLTGIIGGLIYFFVRKRKRVA